MKSAKTVLGLNLYNMALWFVRDHKRMEKTNCPRYWIYKNALRLIPEEYQGDILAHIIEHKPLDKDLIPLEYRFIYAIAEKM